MAGCALSAAEFAAPRRSSLLEYIKAEELEGVECETCAARHDASRRIALIGAKLPPVLTFQLMQLCQEKELKLKIQMCVRLLPTSTPLRHAAARCRQRTPALD